MVQAAKWKNFDKLVVLIPSYENAVHFVCNALLFNVIIGCSNGTVLSNVATQLFKDVKTKLTIKEKNDVAARLGFVLSTDKAQPFALDKDSKDYPFSATALPVDLNKDGKEEVFIFFGNSFTSGSTGSSISLFIKNTSGIYAETLGFPGTIPEALATANLGYPDLLIGGPGFEYPVLRWNGKAYDNYRTVKDSEYDKLKKQSVEDMSKVYQQTIQ